MALSSRANPRLARSTAFSCGACWLALAYLSMGLWANAVAGSPDCGSAASTGIASAKPLGVVPYRSHADRMLTLLDASGREQPITSPEQWRQRREHILAAFLAVAGNLPEHSGEPPRFEVLESIDTDLYRRQKIRFGAADQAREQWIPAYLFLPSKLAAGERRPAMLALHQTTSVGKAEPAGIAGDVNLQYGLELAARGYVVLCPDYPSFGDYAYDFARSPFPSGTLQGVVNHRLAVDLLVHQPAVDAERIGVIGHSLGGHNAIFVAALDERLKVIVSSCGWTPMHDYYGGQLAGWATARYLPRIASDYRLDPDRLPFDLPELIAALAPRGFYSCSPLHDANFDHGGVVKGIEAVRPVFRLLEAEQRLILDTPDAAHSFPAASRRQAYQFIDQQLAHTPAADADFAIELPRIAPREPAEALASFDTLPGWKMELVAAEPLVASPVAMCFDEDARLFVVEMRDYSEQADERLGRVRLLRDTDGDGVYDQATIFADGFSWPTAIVASQGGVFVGAAPDIWFCQDTNGDGVADERRVVFTGFGRANVQGLLNSFRWGLDNRIYGSASTAGGQVRRSGQLADPPLSLAGRDFSFDPRTLELRAETGGGQHGMCFDDWQRRFVSANSDHLQAILFDERYLPSGGATFDAPTRQSIAADGPQAEVYRISPVEPWREVRTRLRVSGQAPGPIEGGGRAAGYFTGATGGTIYRGDAWPPELRGQALIGDVGSNIVHRKQVDEHGVTFIAQRADEQREFVASRDNWFRPVQFANAPDGNLHLIDMYREVIEHPASLPPQIKSFLDLTSGRERGRIYRLVWQAAPRRSAPALGQATTPELVVLLEHANGWHRDTAARLLFERQDQSAVEPLRRLAAASSMPLARMHALYALAAVSALTESELLPRLADPHPRVREHAIRLAERCPGGAAIDAALGDRAVDDDPRVRYQLALTLATRSSPRRLAALAKLAVQPDGEPWIRAAIQLAAGSDSLALWNQVVDQASLEPAGSGQALAPLTAGSIERGSASDAAAILARTAALYQQGSPLAEHCLRGVLLGAGRSAHRATLHEAWSRQPTLQPRAAELLAQARATALSAASRPERLDALRLLRAADFDALEGVLAQLLASEADADIQVEAVRLAGCHDADAVPELLFEAWPQLARAARSEASFVLFSRADWIERAFRAMDIRRIAPQDFDPQAFPLLGERAAELQIRRGIGARAEVVARWQSVLELPGETQRGRAWFRQVCSGCHRVDGVGHEIGPNLAAFANRGAAALLTNILDPNREVGPQFINQVVVTQDGRAHSGIIVAQNASSITLQRGEGLAETLPRDEIEEIRATGQSIMPEGLETQLGEQGLADLIAYLLSAR